MQLMNRCFYYSPRPKWPLLSLQTLWMTSTEGVLLGNHAAKTLACKIFVFQFIESDCQALCFDLNYGMMFGTIHALLPSISGALKSGLKNGKNALIMSLLEQTAVTLIHLIPPFGYPTVSS